ncbi:MAG: hypothetical protein D3923_04165 [Candidatus Electrothrix sp. AR3]|nr:hypothetical protein [Candidatus Electrothrix sp. AR3]
MKVSCYKTITAVLLSSVLFFFSLALAVETSSSEKGNQHPNIAIKKANDASAPVLQVSNGKFLLWSYQVTNTGNVDLKNVRVVDDKLGNIDCPQKALTAGESMTCAGYGASNGGEQNRHKGCATGDHVVINEVGVLVTTRGDCDSGA